jgi:hypothetical protein
MRQLFSRGQIKGIQTLLLFTEGIELGIFRQRTAQLRKGGYQLAPAGISGKSSWPVRSSIAVD